MTHPRVDRLLGTLRKGSRIHEPPAMWKERGVVWIASHPEETPQLITPWGIRPLSFIPDPPTIYPPVPTHSIPGPSRCKGD